MKDSMKFFLIFVLSSFLVACSSGGGGGGGGGTVTPALPADATTLTTANAGTVARSAVDNVVLFGAVTDFRSDGETPPSVSEAINLMIGLAFNNNGRIASRVETVNCDSGNVTLDFNETSTSASGSLTFNNCNLGGATIVGSLTFSSTFNDTTGSYSDSGNGSLTVTASGQSATIAINYSETGNEISGEFSTTITLSVTGTPGSNYLLTTTTPITGVGFDVTGGEVIVEGAGNTRLRITVTGTNVADVYLDDGSGTFVFDSTITF